MLDFCAVWLLLTLLFLIAARRPGRVRVFIWSGILLLLPWMLLKNLGLMAVLAISRRVSLLVFGTGVFGLLLVFALWKPSQQDRFERIQRFMTTILAFAAISGLAILAQLAWMGWRAGNLDAALPLHQRNVRAASHAVKTRVIWILLDELSYRQVYEQRFPGLELPAFDKLAAQSTVFTHTVPAGILTEDVVPALLTGKPVDDMRASSGGQLSTHNPDSGIWQKFDQHRTVFQDALNAGYSTAVVGWYNPYCRLLPEVLDRCFWTFKFPLANGMVPGHSVFANMQAPLLSATGSRTSLLTRFGRNPGNAALESELHQADYHAMFAAADRLLEDPATNFMLLHAPIPHPGGIYDRAKGTFTDGRSTYIDNLALTDKYLAHIRSVLEQNGGWDSSAIIVMGDHSWRTKLIWAAAPDWTKEEEIASGGGQFDDRPAYIVKLPNQRKAARIDAPYAAIRTRSLFDAIFTGRLLTPDDLSKWARQH